eukprot:TRINITY_DN14642_c0_g1_i3.p2 TRINITY_DN14642_c0_g1~~TRINITY_DN14642_c0_g1_i3.p2  ORF type:complete len:320 (+),score=97.15 TRINITY_DN14642_c0_g1_i3:405-1364(+)
MLTAERRLVAIGRKVEHDVCAARGLLSQLSGVGDEYNKAKRPEAAHRERKVRHHTVTRSGRMEGWGYDDDHDDSDTWGVARQDSVLAPSRSASAASEDGDMKYLMLLVSAAHAIDPLFTARVNALSMQHGGTFVSPGAKGHMRMRTKMGSDHRYSGFPRAAENADVVRGAWTLGEAAALRRAFKATCKEFGPPIRVKNTFKSSFDETKGYRCVLANFMCNTGRSWTAVAKESRELWAAVGGKVSSVYSANGMDPEPIVGALSRAQDDLAARDSEAALIVEVQFILEPYLAMRKSTHMWYKVCRAENACALCLDFKGTGP